MGSHRILTGRPAPSRGRFGGWRTQSAIGVVNRWSGELGIRLACTAEPIPMRLARSRLPGGTGEAPATASRLWAIDRC